MNLLVIVVDTLRYDHIGAHGNQWIKTPNLDRLAADSWVFHNSYTASYPTIPHRTDAFTGRYGSPFFPWRPLSHDRMTLPEELGKAGYCTQLIHDTPHLVNGGHNFDWPFHAWTMVRGAEVDRPWIDAPSTLPEHWLPDPVFDYVDRDPLTTPMLVTYARANARRKRPEDWNCARLFLTAARWVRENAPRDRFFLWVDCFDPHEPWDVPPDYARMYVDGPTYDGRVDPRGLAVRNGPLVTEAARARMAAHYAAKVSWVDRWLGELLDALDETGLADATAVVLTADHGTNVGERGQVGKSYPVREQEAHTPFMVRVPGQGGGRSDIIVQPQDLFATAIGLAELPVPEGIESHDVLAVARAGRDGPRQVALSGRNAGPDWAADPGRILFTVLDGEWCLEYAAAPDHCRLTRMGSLDDVAAGNPAVVQRLRAAGLEEIERRGTDPGLMQWLRAEGKADFPTQCTFWDGWPGPAGFTPYFSRLYSGWPV